MRETIDVGRLFFTIGKTGKFFDRAFANEVEAPYRVGKGVGIRIWRRTALIVGWWSDRTSDEVEGLRRILRARDLDVSVEEVSSW